MLRRMTEKDLIAKLNNAKKISPDKSWLASNRELFVNQISNSGASDLAASQSFYISLKSLAKTISQPVLATLAFLFLLLGASVFGDKVFSQAKPNDSLYIARVISEKVKLNTVFDTKTRDELAVKFAASHAKDISQVLANPEFNTEDNQVEVDRLSGEFVKEIETVKTKMTSLALLESKRDKANEKKVDLAEDTKSSTSSATSSQEEPTLKDEGSVAIASEYKTDKGLQLYMSDNNKTSSAKNTSETKATSSEVDSDKKNSSSSEEVAEALLEEVIGESKVDSSVILEVEDLFKAKKFEEVILKIDQIIKK